MSNCNKAKIKKRKFTQFLHEVTYEMCETWIDLHIFLSQRIVIKENKAHWLNRLLCTFLTLFLIKRTLFLIPFESAILNAK